MLPMLPMVPTENPVITGRGMYVPDDVLTNEDVAAVADPARLAAWMEKSKWCGNRLEALRRDAAAACLSDGELQRRLFCDYVGERIGIHSRHVVDRAAILERRVPGRDLFGSDLGALAADRALAEAGVSASEIDVLICGTSSPDRIYPATAVEIQDRIGAGSAYAYDLLAACSSFVYGLQTVRALLIAGCVRRALVVAAEFFTCGVDYGDPSSSYFWGDAAAAAVIEAADLARGKPGYQLLDTLCESRLSQHIRTGLGGTRPFTASLRNGHHPGGLAGNGAAGPSGRTGGTDPSEPGGPAYRFFYQEGHKVYREVIPLAARATRSLLERSGVAVEDVRVFMFHQASALVIDGIKRRLFRDEPPAERVPLNLSRYGNTSSCGVAICLAEERAMEPGELACMTAFGAGYTVGAALLRRVAPAPGAGA
jgi:beta-ketodecanoyl-[acyl-carrier-protein] synthase